MENSGHTRIYQYANETWTQLGTDIDGEAAYITQVISKSFW